MDTLQFVHIPCVIQPVVIASSGVVKLVTIVAVGIVAVIVVAVVVAKVLMWTVVFMIEMPVMFEALFIDVRAGVVINTLVRVEVNIVAAGVIALGFAVIISYFGDVLSDMVVDALVGVLTDVIMAFVTGIGNVFASLMTALEFPVPLVEFGYSEAFDC